jgi:hypothetical protein
MCGWRSYYMNEDQVTDQMGASGLKNLLKWMERVGADGFGVRRGPHGRHRVRIQGKGHDKTFDYEEIDTSSGDPLR